MTKEISFLQRIRFFQRGVICLATIFCLIMVVVVVIAFTRTSHSLKVDAVKLREKKV